jgi:hypothetical protein
MIDVALWEIRCDGCGQVYGRGPSRYELRSNAEDAGWVFYIKRDGTRARRGGKDYCGPCKPQPAGAVQ